MLVLQADMKKRGVDVDDHFIAFEMTISKAREQCIRCVRWTAIFPDEMRPRVVSSSKNPSTGSKIARVSRRFPNTGFKLFKSLGFPRRCYSGLGFLLG